MRNANFAFKCARSFYKMRARNLMNINKHLEAVIRSIDMHIEKLIYNSRAI